MSDLCDRMANDLAFAGAPERAELGNRAGVTAAAIIRYVSTVTVTCGEKLRVALARTV